jgi:putative OPT family oligopeptide transporter
LQNEDVLFSKTKLYIGLSILFFMAQEYIPYISPETSIKEFTLKALLVGAVFSAVFSAANAYLAINSGMTVAAVFPGAVIAMALLRPFKGTILEENTARTAISAGESLAAGLVFTIPAMLILNIWGELEYLTTTLIAFIGGLLGVVLIIFFRRMLVTDKELAFPESVAAAAIIKSGQKGAVGAKYMFGTMGLGVLITFIGKTLDVFKPCVEGIARLGTSVLSYINPATGKALESGTRSSYLYYRTPHAGGIYLGVGYIIGPKLAALNFAGGVFGWLVLLPLAMFFLSELPGGIEIGTIEGANMIQYSLIKPIAAGTMIVGAVHTLYRMKRSFMSGLATAFREIKGGAQRVGKKIRTETDLSMKNVFLLFIVVAIAMGIIYGVITKGVISGGVALIVMIFAAFIFVAISGYIVGLIGSSSNPISGMTLVTLMFAAALMLLLGLGGSTEGMAATILVATVVCCAAGIGGDVMQDLKVGHMLGGTPWKMEIAEIIGVAAAAPCLVIPMNMLHQADIIEGGIGIGGSSLPAPQAGLMAILTQGIVGGGMTWILLVVGILIGVLLVLARTPNVMILAVGMYIPFEVTFAIFVGGIVRLITDRILGKKGVMGEKKRAAINIGILMASGFIAGEALMGVADAGLVIGRIDLALLETPLGWPGFLIIALVAFLLIYFPVKHGEKQLAKS